MAIPGEPFLQDFHLPTDLTGLLLNAELVVQRDLLLLSANQFLIPVGLLSQQPILLAKGIQFFYSHALTLQVFAYSRKSVGDLGSYPYFRFSTIT
jgi:hypothetical protein